MVAADFDGNGAIDIAIVNNWNNKLTIFQNGIPQKGKTNVLEQMFETK